MSAGLGEVGPVGEHFAPTREMVDDDLSAESIRSNWQWLRAGSAMPARRSVGEFGDASDDREAMAGDEFGTR